MSNHWSMKIILMIFFFLTVSLASADDDIESISAGSDQVVNATDTVNLTGLIIYEDEDEDKDKKDEKDDDEVIIKWIQNSGTTAELFNANTLTPHFIAPNSSVSDEILVFTMTVSDDDGELIGSDTVEITVLSTAVLTSQVTGRITSVDGSVIQGVSINVLSLGTSLATTNSDTDGGFSTDLAADSDLVLVLTATGYADQVVPVRTPAVDGSIFLDITMITRGPLQNFDAGVTTTLEGSDGASVSVTAGSFVDANGVTVTGNIDLSVTPVDVSNPSALAAFPGEFSGVLEGDTVNSLIISFGTVEFNFTQNGQPLQLAPGETADVLIPIYFETFQDGTQINIGDNIPLWSLNEETGIWLQEGFGIVVASTASPTGLAMQAPVTHFSWWNCDVSANTGQAIVTVFGPDTGTAVVKARTSANIGWRPDTVDTVIAVGTPTAPLYIPSNGEVCFWAIINFDNGSTGSTQETCLFPAQNSVNNINLIAPVAGPVNIITTPAATAGILNVAAFVNFPVTRVQLQPSTYETVVNYNIISGALPLGMSLNSVNAVRAEIVGTPTSPGTYSVVIEATDSDATTDTVTINYTISTGEPAPMLDFFIRITTISGEEVFNLNDYNTGGTATSWSILPFDVGPLPPEVDLNLSTGILTISSCSNFFWSGPIVASNATGSSDQTFLEISCGFNDLLF